MTETEARDLLGIGPLASQQEIERAYQRLYNDLRLLADQAPTRTVREIHERRTRELEAALVALSHASDASALPTNVPTALGNPATGAGSAPIPGPTPDAPSTAAAAAPLAPATPTDPSPNAGPVWWRRRPAVALAVAVVTVLAVWVIKGLTNRDGAGRTVQSAASAPVVEPAEFVVAGDTVASDSLAASASEGLLPSLVSRAALGVVTGDVRMGGDPTPARFAIAVFRSDYQGLQGWMSFAAPLAHLNDFYRGVLEADGTFDFTNNREGRVETIMRGRARDSVWRGTIEVLDLKTMRQRRGTVTGRAVRGTVPPIVRKSNPWVNSYFHDAFVDSALPRPAAAGSPHCALSLHLKPMSGFMSSGDLTLSTTAPDSECVTEPYPTVLPADVLVRVSGDVVAAADTNRAVALVVLASDSGRLEFRLRSDRSQQVLEVRPDGVQRVVLPWTAPYDETPAPAAQPGVYFGIAARGRHVMVTSVKGQALLAHAIPAPSWRVSLGTAGSNRLKLTTVSAWKY